MQLPQILSSNKTTRRRNTDEVAGTVYKTTNYNKFKRLTGNRNILPRHVKRLAKSFKKDGALLSVVVVNEKMEVIDGQNRIEAAKITGTPVYYIIAKGYGLDETRTLNANNQKWNMVSQLESHINEGIPDYILLGELLKQFPAITLSGAFSAIKKHGKRNSDKETAAFKAGLFKFSKSDYVRTAKIIKEVVKLKQVFKPATTRSFIIAYRHCFFVEGFNPALLFKKLQSRPDLMYQVNKAEQYAQLIETAYNYRNKNKLNLRML